MYEQHFGFKRRPFRAVSTGADVFVGPQTAKIMQATKLALAAPDAVIAVMGPPGTGKTTIVNRALNAIDGDKQIIRIARMQLGHDEVLDFLLDELQAQNVPASTIRKVTLFRRLLADRTAAGVRVIIVLEDAVRIGDDALAEIEALTAADGVGNEGAALVIMGEEALRERLDGDALTRLKQRIRAYQFVNPLAVPELQGYLKHCFRLGGGEFDLVFEPQGAAFVHALTGGIARTANNVVEAVLNAAAARNLQKVDNRFVAAVAQAEFGLAAELPEPATPPAAQPRPQAAPKATVDPAPAATPAAVPQAPEAGGTTAEPADAPAADDGIPELINDTLPDLEVLAPELTADRCADKPQIEPTAERTADTGDAVDDDAIPTLASTAVEPVLDASSTPVADVPAGASMPTGDAPDAQSQVSAEPQPVADPATELAAAPDAVPEPAPKPNATPEPVAERQPETAADPDPLPELKPESAPAPDPVPEMTTAPAAEPKPQPKPRVETVAAQEPPPDPQPVPGPRPDNDPTLAELKPDFDVLEEAMAGLAGDDSVDDDAVKDAPEPVVDEEEERDPTLPSLPTITLDAAIQENIAEATAALEMHDATIADDTVSEETSDIAAAAPKKPAADAISDTDIKKIASGIRKARSLEDVDEKMAETLFGAEFSAIAAHVIANPPPPSETASQPQLNVATEDTPKVPDEAELMQELSLVEDSFASDPKSKAPPAADAPELDAPKTDMEKEFLDVYGENALEVSLESEKPNAGMDLSASQRLATVRALNAEQTPKAAAPPKPTSAVENKSSPQSIEDQITTSMTATLKALSVRPESANDEDDEEEETPKRGFFSRFRRS